MLSHGLQNTVLRLCLHHTLCMASAATTPLCRDGLQGMADIQTPAWHMTLQRMRLALQDTLKCIDILKGCI
jgi:hypothetical protein